MRTASASPTLPQYRRDSPSAASARSSPLGIGYPTGRVVDLRVPSRFASKKKPLISNAYKERLGYDVLLDAGTPHELAEYFRYAAVFVPGDFKLRPNTKDPVIVARAEIDMLLLVTHDSAMDEYVHKHQAGKKMHKCLSGLVLLPSGVTKQKARLHAVVNGERKLKYKDVDLFWYDVWQYNFFVDLDCNSWPAMKPLCKCGDEAFEKHLGAGRMLIKNPPKKPYTL